MKGIFNEGVFNTLTTAAPNITTNNSDPAPITITAIAHCGINEFCSTSPGCVGGACDFGMTVIQ